VSSSPTPSEIYARRREEGRRRLDSSVAAQVSGVFTAGFVIAFGIAASGAAAALVASRFGTGPGEVAGALAFGVGVAFVVLARAELLFTENLLDPVLALRRPLAREGGRCCASGWWRWW
jgi:formate-nitrite transporter family protein